MPDRMPCQIECQKICQIECQKICQIECQKICQIESQTDCQIECQKICQTECQMGWIECHGGNHSKQSNFAFPSGPLFLAIRSILELKCVICWAKIFHLHAIRIILEGKKTTTTIKPTSQEAKKLRRQKSNKPRSKNPQTPRNQKPHKPQKPQKLHKKQKPRSQTGKQKSPLKNSLYIVWYHQQKNKEHSLDPSVNQTRQVGKSYCEACYEQEEPKVFREK